VSSAAALAGWVAAGIAAAMMIAVRRMLGSRMEAVARACHELRGPLTAARLGLSLGRATLALQDLDDFGRASPRMRELEKLDVLELMIDCKHASFGLADFMGATMMGSWDGPRVSVWGDRLRLAQALGNLISNAIEHGGGLVHVCGVVGQATVRIEVSDEGPGLPAPVAELSRRKRRGGCARGRGLAIVTAIAEAHGGRVVTAPADRGARVILELPLPPAPAAG
jgi:signal transduction histidine kinase